MPNAAWEPRVGHGRFLVPVGQSLHREGPASASRPRSPRPLRDEGSRHRRGQAKRGWTHRTDSPGREAPRLPGARRHPAEDRETALSQGCSSQSPGSVATTRILVEHEQSRSPLHQSDLPVPSPILASGELVSVVVAPAAPSVSFSTSGRVVGLFTCGQHRPMRSGARNYPQGAQVISPRFSRAGPIA